MKKSEIESKKGFSEILKRAEQNSKPSQCFLCKKKISSCCNSHIVPQFILKGLTNNGKISYGQSLYKDQELFIDTTKGLNNAFTFKLICKECDNKEFSLYEKPEMIVEFDKYDITTKKLILIEMAIKAHLAHVYNKYKMNNLNLIMYPEEMEILKKMNIKTAYVLDIQEHKEYIQKLQGYRKRNNFPIEILWDKLLDYKLNIATQTIMAYVYDLQGNQLFDPKDLKSVNISKYFYLMILPYKNYTRILFYIEKANTSFVKGIINDFNILSEEDKLHFIFISLMSIDEQFFINPNFKEVLRKDKKLIKLYTKTDDIYAAQHKIEIKNFKKYKNYFSKEYNV